MMSSRTERLYVGGTAFVAVVIAAVGWFFLVSPQRDDTADIESQVATAQLHNDTLQAGLGRLRSEQRNAAKYDAILSDLHTAVPDRSNMSSFLRFLQSVGKATSTTVSAVTVGDAEALTPAAAPAAPASSASSSASSSSAPSSAPGAAAVPAATLSGVLGIPINATVTGSEPALRRFLGELRVQKQDRAVLITSVTRGAQGSGSNMQVAMTAFVRPAAAATAATPSATAGG